MYMCVCVLHVYDRMHDSEVAMVRLEKGGGLLLLAGEGGRGVSVSFL